MGILISILICDLLIPVTMFAFGLYFTNRAPKSINHLFGYRTTMSMKNKDTWEFAHKYCGKVWLIVGTVLLLVTLVLFLLLSRVDTDVAETVSLIFCTVQLVCLLVSIIPTERALKRNFDSNGIRKNNVSK